MPDLRPRYLACVDPAVAACLGAGIALSARRRPAAGALVLAVVLVVPAVTSIVAVANATQDANRTGALPQPRVDALAAYLRVAHAESRLAVSAPSKAGQLIATEGRPVLILSDGQGRQLVSVHQLARDVSDGSVRYALLGDACTATSGNARTGCLPVVQWAHAHGVDVSLAAGQPRRGALYALTPRASAAAATGRTPTSARSPRTGRAAARSASRRASRARHRRASRARRSSAQRNGARRARARRHLA